MALRHGPQPAARRAAEAVTGGGDLPAGAFGDDPDVVGIEPRVQCALAALSPGDREALMLVAFDDLTPAMAARALGINPSAFRVRLHRARRRFLAALDVPGQPARTEMEIA